MEAEAFHRLKMSGRHCWFCLRAVGDQSSVVGCTDRRPRFEAKNESKNKPQRSNNDASLFLHPLLLPLTLLHDRSPVILTVSLQCIIGDLIAESLVMDCWRPPGRHEAEVAINDEQHHNASVLAPPKVSPNY